MSKNVILEVTDLCIGYDGRSIFDDICFSLSEGSYLCIVGENGAGKSTLLKTLAGLLKPVYGTVNFDTPRSEIGYLPQQAAVSQEFPASAIEIVSSGALGLSKWYRPFFNNEEKEKIRWACDKTGVLKFSDQCFRELSGGQQRRVLLARALVSAKNVIILDEPTAGLDSEAMKDFYELLAKINHEDKITIIMVTHDTESAMKHATHILHLHGQKGIGDDVSDYFFGEINELKSNDIALKGGCHL